MVKARLALAFVALAVVSGNAFARANDRVTARIDLASGSVTLAALPTSSTPVVATAHPPQASASLRSGALDVIDALGAKHTVATIDPRSWVTWQVHSGSTLVFAVRTFGLASGKAADDGVDVIRAFSDAGAMAWIRSTTGWTPSAYVIDGALAMASSDLELVDPATARPRCCVATSGWPAGIVALDPTTALFVTTAQSKAFDPTTCAVRWTAPYTGGERLPVLYRGKLYEAAPGKTATGWTMSILERDARSGALGRTFAVATKTSFYDQAHATIIPNGDSLYVEASFIVLD
jgi:hypothetical protein